MNGLDLLKCICDETRFSILEMLQRQNELCVSDFVTALKKDQPLISHHLKILKQCGVLTSRENGKMIMYSISSKQISGLIDNVTKASKKIVSLCDCKTCC